MFEKNMRLAFLLDFYGEALDEHTRDIMKAYYEDDLSLSEIAEDEGISRQGVRHIIKKGEDQLDFLENKLKLASHSAELRQAADSLLAIRNKLSERRDFNFQNEIAMLDEVIGTIINKGV